MTNESTPGALPIQQYINLLQQSPSSDASYVRTIVLKALSDSTVYAGFNELHYIPAVQKLGENSTGKSLLSTLTLFSCGTYKDYTRTTADSSDSSAYIELNDAQLFKLKALTVVTVINDHFNPSSSTGVGVKKEGKQEVTNTRRNRRRNQRSSSSTNNVNANSGTVPYAIFQQELGLSTSSEGSTGAISVRTLEDLLIHCVYADLLPPGTKLNQKHMCLEVRLSCPMKLVEGSAESNGIVNSPNVLCRDVDIETDLPEMITQLEEFYRNGLAFKTSLERGIQKLKEDASNEHTGWNEIKSEMKTMDEKIGGGSGMDTIVENTANWSTSDRGSSRQVKRSRAGHGLHGAKKGFLNYGKK